VAAPTEILVTTGAVVVGTTILIIAAIAASRRLKAERQRTLEESRRFAEQLDSLAASVLVLVSKYAALLAFSSGYLMKKDYDQLRAEAAPVVARILEVPAEHRCIHPQAEDIQKLLAWYTNEGLREQRNNEYKAHEMAACARLFDDINGNRLDNQQRDAVVTDEYSNLVIAGAGSGKTLTVVGKLKYLVERWRVNPSEILVTSFTRKSVEELAARIAQAGVHGVSTKTFHALGLSVLDKPAVANENELSSCILRYLRSEILESPDRIKAYLEFYGCYSYIPEDYGEFDSDSDRIQELKSMDLVTLKGQLYGVAEERKGAHDTLQGEKVKSLEELIIANHLFLNGVQYEYERPYSGAYESKGSRAYQPDFYLPDYDIWLEHFGIDENGLAPWLGSLGEERKYCNDIVWKRGVHKQNQTRLIESYSFWNKDNKLIDNLDALLTSNGVELRQDLDMLVRHYERLCQDEKLLKSIVELISTFVSLFKANNTTLTAVNQKAMAAYRDDAFMLHRYQLFIEFTAPIIKFYQLVLRGKDLVDFDDMINHATQAIRINGVPEHYKYIIVDEYQDISASRFGLINAIRDKTGAKLVCVGDDWQSIYRFAGSDVTLFTSFDKFSGFHEKLRIEGTYRNSQSLIDTASEFIMENPSQLPKVMVSRKPQQNPSPIAVLSLKSQVEALSQALDEILASEGFSGSILILGRLNDDLDSLFNDRNTAGAPDEVLRRFTSRKDTKSGDIDVAYRGYSNIKFITVHRAKGLEADEVIVLNLVNDKYGFPNKIADDPLLNLLLADSDDYQYAEERRLFYVAMTRTRNRVYLITSHAEAYKGHSVFVDELLDDNGNEAIRLITEEGERAPTHCPRCGKGILVVRRNSMDGREFLGCTNYPFCEKTYPSTEVLRHQVKCPQCGGWMVKRSGRYGDFYGCTNFSDGCKATIDIASTYKGSHTLTSVGRQAGASGRSSQLRNNRAGHTVKKGQSTGPSCPVCGASMVLRTGPYGQFYGCSSWPSCPGTRKRGYR
jgi:DNA helicase-4